MPKQKFETRTDLYCPSCGDNKMRPLEVKAESGRTRYRCGTCQIRTTSTLYTPPQILPKTRVSDIRKFKRFIITSAVNDTPLVKKAHETFKKMAESLEAAYLIIPGVYKNPDLKHQGVINNYTWPEEILPFLCNCDISLNESIAIRGLTRIQYTNINPLSGMNHAGGIQSEVYGHPQVAMQMVPTAKDQLPKMLHTTGTISAKNYGGSPTAKKASFHHSISALLIEIEGDKFWPTQLHFDGEGVALFDKFYTPTSVRKIKSIPAIVFGDSHVKFLTPTVDKLNNKIRKALQPEAEVYHDLHDHHIGSHHTDKNVIFKLKKCIQQDWCIRSELMLSVQFLKNKPNAVLIDSNHHRHLDQWFNRFDPKRDPVNIDLYFELAEMLRVDIRKGGDGNLFRLFLERYAKKPVKFVDGNSRFLIKKIDCSQHGDVGPNGSRGSAKSFSKTGNKTIIGHSHTPGVEKGCYQVGTSTHELEYAVGYTSWMITHCLIYNNGKRGMFNIVKNKLSPLMRQL